MADNSLQPHQSIRLNKFLAERLGISRREADSFIEKGKVFVDGKKAILGAHIDEKSKVVFDNKEVSFDAQYKYIAFNKPVGYVCSRRAQGDAPTLYSLLPDNFSKLKTVGRLDKDSSGLILLTNDGDFAFQMTHPKFHKEKIYNVILDHDLEPLHQQMIADYGVKLEDGVSQFGVIRDYNFDDRSHFVVTLSEGRNRQIRRTFATLGYKVIGLHRTQFGKYQLSGLESGKFVEFSK